MQITVAKAIDDLVVNPFKGREFLLRTGPGVAKFTGGDAFGERKRQEAVAHAQRELKDVANNDARRKLYELQAACANLPDVEFPLQHTFAPGVYVRTIFLPAGSVIVGKIHKHRHANILSMGRVTVVTEGGGVEDLEGPLTMVSLPGTKRAVCAHTDAVWTTIHPTNSTDLGEIERETIAETYAEYEEFVRAGGQA